jgi:hypothetical protein
MTYVKCVWKLMDTSYLKYIERLRNNFIIFLYRFYDSDIIST